MSDFEIREASVADVPDLIRLVQALAAYEKEPDAATATPDQFRDALFPAQGDPTAYALVGVREGAVVAMAIWFRSFSTWTGQAGIWLEDLFVEPDQRGHGLGKALLARLAQLCVERGWTRLEWTVLDWNTPSIEFYRAHGARSLDDWSTFRVDGDALPRAGGDDVRRPPRRMGSADVLWLNMDRPTNLMVIVSVVLLESVPDWDRVLDLMRTRILEPYPVFSQRPVRPRRTLGRYHWEDDPDFDLARHVRRATLSGKGTAAEADAELQAYIEEHLPHPFDRSRPLWEVHLVDGHGPGAALVFRIHHALADGIALTRVLLGLTEDAAGVPGDLVGPLGEDRPADHDPRCRRIVGRHRLRRAPRAGLRPLGVGSPARQGRPSRGDRRGGSHPPHRSGRLRPAAHDEPGQRRPVLLVGGEW